MLLSNHEGFVKIAKELEEAGPYDEFIDRHNPLSNVPLNRGLLGASGGLMGGSLGTLGAEKLMKVPNTKGKLLGAALGASTGAGTGALVGGGLANRFNKKQLKRRDEEVAALVGMDDAEREEYMNQKNNELDKQIAMVNGMAMGMLI